MKGKIPVCVIWSGVGVVITISGFILYKIIKNKKRLVSKKKNVNFLIDKPSKAEIFERRKKYLIPSLSVSYSNSDPLLIVKGKGQYLYDENGVKYLDTRNNVAHVGHSHPKVAEAIAKQAAILNTNTRYLHPNLTNLAQELLSTFPSKLCKCVFVNSGSEANDLALRMARTHTKNYDVVVVEQGYHGNTFSDIEISSYKFDHVGGPGQPSWVHKVPIPHAKKGQFTDSVQASKHFSEFVKEACKNANSKVSAFFMESALSVGGVIIPPEGYLEQVYKYIHEAGGVCVADEVQVGFGRLGKTFWAFELQNVVPDIVTIGKPFGNGMPLAAVVTTEEIANSFANGLEYFNTFGGNPVVCAAGLAVMEIIKEENLQENALIVGDYLIKRFTELSKQYSNIADVRGSGLFVGIEIVDEKGLPSASYASNICTQLKNKHKILTSLDGKDDNIIVIKPPMCFSTTNVDYFVFSVEQELKHLQENPSHFPLTPT